MILNSHLRLAIPASTAEVVAFHRSVDAGIKVPAMIGFQNDGDQDVTLSFDAGSNKGMIVSTVDGSGNYNIGSGTSDKVKVAIDGEAAVTITLTNGASRTRAQVIADINTALLAAGGNTALAKAILVGTKYIAIVSGTAGIGSSVEIVTVATNAYTVLGLTVGVYVPTNSWQPDIVSSITIKSKGYAAFTNPRPGAASLRIRGTGSGVATVIDATPMYVYNGVQQ